MKRLREEILSFGWIILVVLCIRAFIIEPYKIPTASMVPSLLGGDHIFVLKFAYAVGIPFTKIKLFDTSSVRRGDVAVFKYPVNESTNFVKRVIGLPGDTISIQNRVLYINHQPVTLKRTQDEAIMAPVQNVHRNAGQEVYLETFPKGSGFDEANTHDEPHTIIWDSSRPNAYNQYFGPITVPKNHYFVMGDNRDRSLDSRAWGFVPRENLKGQGILIWLSYYNLERSWVDFADKFRWKRFFSVID